jgi:hypothetical protein
LGIEDPEEEKIGEEEIILSKNLIYKEIRITLSSCLTKEDVWNHIMNLLNNLGVDQKFSYNLTNNFDIDKRKVTSKILMASNFIAVNSQIGPSRFAIIGSDIDKSLLENIGIDYIFDDKIDPNKIILGRNTTESLGHGIYVIESDKGFYIKETEFWNKNFISFIVN